MSASQAFAGVGGSGESQQDLTYYAQLWEGLAIQIHDLNEAKVVAMTGAFYTALDHAGRRYMQDRMKAITESQHAFFVRDGMHPDRWLLGNYDDLQSVPGSAIYILNGLPTLSLNGPDCPYPNPPAQGNQAIIDVNMAMYQSAIPSSPDITSDSQTDGTANLSSASNAQDTDVEVNTVKISRPPNAYILYRKDKHPQIEAGYPGIRNNEISVIAGSMWNTESPDVRAEYAAKAEALKAQHKLMYPDYKYAPRRPEQVKRRAKRTVGKVSKDKKVKGKISKPRKVLIGDLGETHMRMLNKEANMAVGTMASGPGSDTNRQQTINVGISASTELQTQSDIDEWNAAVPQHHGFIFNSPLDGDMIDFFNTDQFDSGNDGDMDQSVF